MSFHWLSAYAHCSTARATEGLFNLLDKPRHMAFKQPRDSGDTSILTTNVLKATAEALPLAAIIIDQKGVIRFANHLAHDILQLNLEGLVFNTILRDAELNTAVAQCRASHEAVNVDLEVHGQLPRIFGAHVAAIADTEYLLITLRDLTREQAIEKMRSDFVANASHEMRTPLSSIMGYIETLQGPAKNDAKAREKFLDTMITQARRMKRLIDDLLILSRIELNEHVRPSARVDLLEVAKQAKSNLAPMAKDYKVSVEIQGDAPVLVQGEGDELLQVAQNLLENALKYGGEGGRVEILCSQNTQNAVMAVRDFGKGIAAIHLPRLTERFYRVNTQESRNRGGTGLGLAIVKHIVQRHWGRLEIHSVQDQGSTFSVTIPPYKSTR